MAPHYHQHQKNPLDLINTQLSRRFPFFMVIINSTLNNLISSFRYYLMVLNFINISQNHLFLFRFVKFHYSSIHSNTHFIIIMKFLYFIANQLQN